MPLSREELLKTPTLKQAIRILTKNRGLTLRKTCENLGIKWTHASKNKGAGGLIGELILGLENNGRCAPDIEEYGVEVKYLPVYMDKKIPKEPTQITMIHYDEVCMQKWSSAKIRGKIDKVFWVAYEVPRKRKKWDQQDYTLLGYHLEIMPDDDLRVCQRDWDEIRTCILAGGADKLSCSMGVFIEPKTKGKNKLDKREAPGINGSRIMARRRAFYFKKNYTRTRIIPKILVSCGIH